MSAAWVIGWLFTVGYCATEVEKMKWYEQIGTLAAWPFLLGLEARKSVARWGGYETET